MTIEEMKQWLEALESIQWLEQDAQWARKIHKSVESLRQVIEQYEKQEPVGEVLNERGEVDYISYVPPAGTLLYTAPQPQREWVGLTDEDKNNA